jgi:hypothetical protein
MPIRLAAPSHFLPSFVVLSLMWGRDAYQTWPMSVVGREIGSLQTSSGAPTLTAVTT